MLDDICEDDSGSVWINSLDGTVAYDFEPRKNSSGDVNVNQSKSFCLLMLAGCMLLFCGDAQAHSVFKKQMAAKYPNKKISCNTCHVEKQPKTERNAYGKLFHKTFESKTLTADFKAKGSRAEKKAFETEVMAVEFDKAFEKVKAMTVHDLIEAGVIEGITEKEKEE